MQEISKKYPRNTHGQTHVQGHLFTLIVASKELYCCSLNVEELEAMHVAAISNHYYSLAATERADSSMPEFMIHIIDHLCCTC